MNTHGLQVDVERMQCGECTLDELREFARHPAGLIRVNAVDAIARFHDGEDATTVLINAANSKENDVQLMGTATIAFVAIGKLLASTDAKRRSSGSHIVSTLSDDTRSLLLEYLELEGIALPCSST